MCGDAFSTSSISKKSSLPGAVISGMPVPASFSPAKSHHSSTRSHTSFLNSFSRRASSAESSRNSSSDMTMG